MISKSILALGAVAALATVASAPAQAKVNIDLYVGGGGYAPGYYDPSPSYPVYDNGHRRDGGGYGYRDYGISCEDGIDEVRYAGYRKVRPVDCSGKRYTYKARRDGEQFIIRVSRRNGNIVSVEQAW
jgi:hypothetical protein